MGIERRLAIDELAERLALPRTTVYYWVRDLPIPSSGPGGYHADQGLQKLREFWGACVGVDPNEMRLQRKSNSSQLAGRSWRSRYRVLTISAYDTLMRARLEAWIDRLRSEWQ